MLSHITSHIDPNPTQWIWGLIVESFGCQNFFFTLHLDFLGSAHVVLLRSSRWDIRFWQSKCLLESNHEIDRYM